MSHLKDSYRSYVAGGFGIAESRLLDAIRFAGAPVSRAANRLTEIHQEPLVRRTPWAEGTQGETRSRNKDRGALNVPTVRDQAYLAIEQIATASAEATSAIIRALAQYNDTIDSIDAAAAELAAAEEQDA